MRALAAILILGAAAPALAADADPLAAGRAGKAQCFTPNEKARTCRQIVTFTFGAGGVIETHASTALNENVVMHHGGAVTLRGGAVCRRLAADDLERATFSIGGKPASAADTQGLRAEVKKEYADMVGKELCTAYRPSGKYASASLTMDGVPQPDVTDKVLWIAPNAYKVAAQTP